MSYYKRVVYMDCYENGEKVSNGGFVKLLKLKKEEETFARKPEETGRERLCIQIQALNLPWRDGLWGNVKLLKDEREISLGNIKLNGGKGMLQIKDLDEFLRKNGVKDAGEICEKLGDWGIKVKLTPDSELWCRLGMQQEERKETVEEDKRMPDVMRERRESDEVVEREKYDAIVKDELRQSDLEMANEPGNLEKNRLGQRYMENEPGDREKKQSGWRYMENEPGNLEKNRPGQRYMENEPGDCEKKQSGWRYMENEPGNLEENRLGERDVEDEQGTRGIKNSLDEWKIEQKTNQHDVRKDSREHMMRSESNIQEMRTGSGGCETENRPGEREMRNRPGNRETENRPGDRETENRPGEQEIKNESGTKEKRKEPDAQESRNKPKRVPEKMQRDKWKQLWEIFPHNCPFQDEREYLQLSLRDLLVLAGRYYRLVENSFLLHGYYNYEHLVLMRTYRRGAEKYYLGVPGNYYEREKQVAVWFGFESFETRSEPAAEGDFGYYMISVDI